MKQPKTIMKTGSNSEEFEVENPDYKKKRWKPTNMKPKKKKRK